MGYTDLLTRNAYTPTDVIVIANDAETQDASVTYKKVKEITLQYPVVGSSLLRFQFETKIAHASHQGNARLYINGVAVGTERIPTTTYQTFTEDQVSGNWMIGDKVQLYVKNDGGGFPTYVKNFRLLGSGSEFVNTMV